MCLSLRTEEQARNGRSVETPCSILSSVVWVRDVADGFIVCSMVVVRKEVARCKICCSCRSIGISVRDRDVEAKNGRHVMPGGLDQPRLGCWVPRGR